MTANPIPPITCPSSLVASCAPLLGFVPSASMVVLIHGPRSGLPVVMRVDLPLPAEVEAWARTVAASVGNAGAIAVDLVAWVDVDDGALRSGLPSTSAADALVRTLEDLGVEVVDAVSTNGRRWWGHRCDEPDCCPDQGSRLDSGTMTAVQAEYVFAGCAPLGSRDQVAERISPDAARAAAAGVAMTQVQKPRRIERWRDAQIAWLSDLLLTEHRRAPQPRRALDARRAARLHLALADIRVRDTLVRRLALADRSCAQCGAEQVEVLCDALRSAPRGTAAPAATVLAIVAWIHGEGALATIALDRAHEEDPGYRLADLTSRLIARGTDPLVWRASMATLSEAECRGRRAGLRSVPDRPDARIEA